jgi:hypothetical protein
MKKVSSGSVSMGYALKKSDVAVWNSGTTGILHSETRFGE